VGVTQAREQDAFWCDASAASGKRLGHVMLTTTANSYSLLATYIDRARKPSWKGRRMQFVIAWPDRKDLWNRYIESRQARPALFCTASGGR
jgi:hypothetical protein